MSASNLRKVYVNRLLDLAAQDSRIVSLDSDSREATCVDGFAATYPDRSFSFGIAEQDMVVSAAGMATMGLIPFVNSYAMFIVMRALDQVRNAVAYPKLNVKFVLSHHGLDSGSDGVTHQLTEDVAILRAIPELVLIHPADAAEMRQVVDWAIEHDGPVIIKSGKSSVPEVHDSSFRFRLGIPSLLRDGTDVAIAANGVMVSRALAAAAELEHLGISTRVVNVSTLAGGTTQPLLDAFDGISIVVTMEDHSRAGGLGGVLAEIFAENSPRRVLRVGLGNSFAECGDPSHLFRKYCMDEAEVVRLVTTSLQGP